MEDYEEPDDGLFEDVLEILANYARLDNTEFGEMANALIQAYEVSHYGMTDEFVNALEKEIWEHYKSYYENTTIIERYTTVSYQELVYNWEIEDEEE